MRQQIDQGPPWPAGLHLSLLRASLLDGQGAEEAFHQWSSTVIFDDLDYPSIGLMPLLRWNLKRQGISHPLMPRIESVGRYLLLETMMKLGAMGALVSDLNQEEVPALLLWGGAMGQQYYPQVSLRPINRCGVMIRHDDWDRSSERLKLKGWKFSSGAKDDEKEFNLLQRPEYPNVSIQLLLGNGIESSMQNKGPFSSNSREIIFQGNSCRVLHPVDEIVQACREGHRQRSPLSSKLWLVDCAMMIRNSAVSGDLQDWEEYVRDPQEALLVRQSLDWIFQLKTGFSSSPSQQRPGCIASS
jgi:hypothetical protein